MIYCDFDILHFDIWCGPCVYYLSGSVHGCSVRPGPYTVWKGGQTHGEEEEEEKKEEEEEEGEEEEEEEERKASDWTPLLRETERESTI